MEKHIRLRLALSVFGHSGYARLDTTIKPTPMVVPTAKLLNLLELTSLTTDLEPLTLPPVPCRIGKSEASRQSQYLQAFKSDMAERMARFLIVAADLLNSWERGLLRHGRRPNGDVAWFSIEASGKGGGYGQAPARLKREPPLCTPMKGVKLEFEIDSEIILLLHEDDLPFRPEVLEVLQISDKELEALFKAAAKLLSQTIRLSECGPMRLKSRAANGAWSHCLPD